MKTSVLKPGFLVCLRTTLRGGVQYRRVDVETEHQTEQGALRAKWETTKEITDPDDFKAGTEARSLARSTVGAVCAYSPNFGFMAPLDKEQALTQAIIDARAIATAYNARATTNQLTVSVICGRIAQDDAEAARAIGAELRELMEQMKAGIKAADPAMIREAANKARGLGTMLSADVAGQVSAAIVEARSAAREITRRVEKAGERAADVVADLQTKRIDSARFSFLDLDESAAEVESVAPAARGIDYEPEPQQAAYSAAPAAVRSLELF